jgi:ribose transport system permease protein
MVRGIGKLTVKQLSAPSTWRLALPSLPSWILPYLSVLALVTLILAFKPEVFLSGNDRNLLLATSFIGITATGQTLVIITGNIDLSIPWTLNCSAILLASLHASGCPGWAAVLITILFGLAVGFLNGFGVAYLRVNSLIWTLGMNFVLQGAALVYVNSQLSRSLVPPEAVFLCNGTFLGRPLAIWITLVIVAIAAFFIHFTAGGRLMLLAGANPQAVLFSGIDPRCPVFRAMTVSGATAALTGVLLAGYSGQSFLGMGDEYLLFPIAAVVLGGTSIMGGTGGPIRTLAGTLFVALANFLVTIVQIDHAVKLALFGCVILLAVCLNGRERNAVAKRRATKVT